MYGLSDEDLRIRDTASAFAESLMPYEAEAEAAGGKMPKELTEKFQARAIELGLYATNIPKSAGGPGCTALQQVLVQEQVGRVTNGLAWVMHTPPQWWVEVATDHQRQRWLLPTVRGEKHEAYAITEEFAGSDVSDLAATARREGDEYVINAVKWHVTSFNLADYVFVQAVLENGDHAGDHVLLVVDLPSPGVEVVRTPQYSHHIADEHPIVAFTDVRVPATHLVGAEGQGMTFTQDWFRFERLMVAARCVGAAQRLLDETTAFARTRIVDGKPLGDHQLVAGMLADSATELFAARTMLYEVARSIDAGLDRKTLHGQASMAKLYCSEMAGRAADRAVQVFGGRGYMRENVAERMFRELRVERIWEGASEIQRIIVARQLMNRGPQALLGTAG
ncbi:acyl-CoA dehydrogenase family protein [Mycolicibacterium smegmatis]|uniref:acyl-CoA dehydrogenase family protein n=1 Tax=Mycolicibacterium smegmatis TaxID=1772 RepID=UPI0005D90EB2|nr:acyl-CoA dehydrogenase family protein [Mycolicibacterium smegmatis]MDF1900718.1 acyl-CoA/acyl-ACP dehydrogenase [Mycolicibacterium smegmatis]MDF1906997.1 acyl-CoA/acyl-ACP dehydrogenase [Mycolicibacterium smegmatis]MDF1919192.1 acyl-CoA/acyl-ACP dehydrogenase [Mycolicibacterium smegmatis]MDF1925259.1 acyl-CoA/acyl-ACP dehydrogenase [Mycolicibacterium smegmatis]UAK52950.1 acyl-CoA/acyl-ACP dehydrogenase [Mycolicibacterium smegmatis]